MTRQIEALFADKVIEEQKYVLFSYISPKKVKNITDSYFIFRGAFPTIEDAKKHCEHLQKINNDFDIFIGEGFKWVPFDQDLDKTDEMCYSDKKLNEIMTEYQTQLKDKNEIEQQRKHDMQKTLLKENKAKKAKKIDHQIKQSIKEKIKDATKKDIKEAENNIKQIDETINKLDEVYKKLELNQK